MNLLPQMPRKALQGRITLQRYNNPLKQASNSGKNYLFSDRFRPKHENRRRMTYPLSAIPVFICCCSWALWGYWAEWAAAQAH